MYLFSLKISVLLIVLYFDINFASKLNVPRVLLPYNHDEYPSNFTLKVHDGGCYKWTSTRDEVIIEEILAANDCSYEAIVSANSRSSARLTAIVIAKDIETGISMRCDVIIDAIENLQIVTTTRELYAEEAPEEFEVRAYDLYGNEFSTLEGQKFIWDLQTITDHEAVVPAQTVLRFISFEASPYETPPSIAPLEARGEKGYMVLIEGRQTGLARLSVRLAQPSYKKLPPASVDLMVIANLILEPQDVYILSHTSIQYSVMHLKQGIFHPVDIQGSQYYLQVSDSDIGILDEDGIHVTGLSHGSTQVILKDNHVKSSETLKQPTASLHVVEPSYLTITILPHNYPSLIVENNYVFVINLFDRSNNRIHVTENIIVETFVPEEYFSTEFISLNGTFIATSPIKTGSTKITAKLTSVRISPDEVMELSPPLKASQSVDIFQKITVIPKLTFLPWDPIRKPSYKVNLTVDRYNDSVAWSSNKSDLLNVNRFGNCHTNGRGVATVTASLLVNPHNKDSAQIVIGEALALYILESIVEVEVNSVVFLPVALSTSYLESEFYFNVCNQLPFVVEPDQLSFIAYPDMTESKVENSCAEVKLVSKRGGFSTIKVSYSSSTGKLESEALVAAFYPLKPISPSSSLTVLALETSRIVLFEGGPLPWTKKPSNHFSEVEVSSPDDLLAYLVLPRTPSSRTDIYAVYVECHQLGSFTLKLTVGNRPSSTLPFPKIVFSTVTVVCALPEALILRSLLTSSNSCPSFSGPDETVGHCRKPIPLEAEIQDGEGRKFDNASSLSLNWLISDKALASFPAHQSGPSELSKVHGFAMPYRIEREVHPHGLAGEFVVTVEMTGFHSPSIQSLGLPLLQDSLQIRLVEDALLHPFHLVLFNQGEIQEEVKVVGGSGYFNLINEKSPVASLRYLPQDQTILVSPLSDGNMTLMVQDLCLPGAPTINSTLRVSSIASLDLKMFERVEVDSSIEAEAIVQDADGNVIPANEFMQLLPHAQSNIISISYKGINKMGNALYDVKGLVAGDTTVKISSQSAMSDGPLYSNSRPLQVFPPLRVFPRNITLIVGAIFQVETKGGPYPNSAVEFYIKNETVASTSYTGIVTAMSLGTTLLNAKSVSVGKDQQPLIISQDTVTINVIPIDAIRIYSPLRHIETGATMPLYMIGSDYLTPLYYATAFPPLVFEWSVSNEQVAVLKTAYEENGIIEVKENLSVLRFQAIKPGRVTVTVKVKVSVSQSLQKLQIKDNIILTDKIEIKVFESLRLKSPQSDDARILLSPKSQTRIMTNRDKESTLSYAVDCKSRQSSMPLIEVSDGLVTAKSETGESSVLVTLDKPFGVTQSIAVGVEVRTISYVLAVPEVFMNPVKYSFLGNLPLGISHTLKLQYHDNRGRIFTSVNAEMDYRLSRFDLVNVRFGANNNTLTLTVRDIGHTILHIWLKDNPLINDYLRISSGPGISPHKVSVQLGGLVCFSSNLMGLNETRGLWGSESTGFEIDPLTGIGASHQVGKFLVTYQVTPTVITTTEIHVVPISKISVDPDQISISNIFGSNSWFLPVTLIGEGNVHFPSCSASVLPKVHIPFTCDFVIDSEASFEIKQLFVVAPVHIHEKGFGCEVKSVSGPDLILSSTDLQLGIEVVVPSRGPQKEIRSGASWVRFLPAVVPDKTEVLLFSDESTKEVILHGREDILASFIVSEEPRNVNIVMEPADKVSRRVVFSIKEPLLGRCSISESSRASLTSVLNHQIIELQVNFKSSGVAGSEICEPQEVKSGLFSGLTKWWTLYQGHAFFLMCVIITVICLCYGFYAVNGSSYKQTQNQTVFASSTVHSPCQVGFPGSPCGPDCTGLKKRLVFSSPTSPRSSFPLWSDDKEPVYGDPLFRSSPRPAYDGSPTYS